MRVPSTVAQFAAAGVSLALEAASIVACANSSSPSSGWSDVRAGVSPFSARMRLVVVAQHQRDDVAGQVLVGRLRGDGDVGAAEQHRRGATVGAG